MRQIRKNLTVKQRVKIIKLVDKDVKKIEVAKKFRLARCSVTAILKKKEAILNASEHLVNLTVRKNRGVNNSDLQKAVLYFITMARNANIPLNGQIVRAKVKYYIHAFVELVDIN